MIKNLANFQKKIGINFHNEKLLTKSFTHKSYNPIENNEKLESISKEAIDLINKKYKEDFFNKNLSQIIGLKFEKHNKE